MVKHYTSLVFTSALTLFGLATLSAQVYVAPGGTGAGTSWADASGDLAAEMLSAAPGTQIWVQQGTYTPTTFVPVPCDDTDMDLMNNCDPTPRRVSFQMRPGVSVIGGFTGNETAASQADSSNTTTLSGDIDGDGTLANNSFTVVYCDDCGSASALTNLVIRGGNAVGPDPSRKGDQEGGGMYLYGGLGKDASPTFTFVSVLRNFALDGGGGVVVVSEGNSSNPGKAKPTFKNSRIERNRTFENGGGLRILSQSFSGGQSGVADVLLENSSVSFNRADYDETTTSDNFGGGIHTENSSGLVLLTLRQTRIHRNVSDAFTATADTTQDGNVGASNGGGIYIQGSTSGESDLLIENSILSHNQAFAGGGVYVNKGDIIIRNSTIAYNAAVGNAGNGGGVYVNGGSTGSPNGEGATGTITNSIIYGNTERVGSNDSEVLNQVGSNVTISYSLVDKDECVGATAGDGNDDPNDIANYVNIVGQSVSTLNCGPGMIYRPYTTDPIATTGLPVLVAGSPAIDAGDPAFTSAGADFAGNQRVADGRVDIGAFEFMSSPLPVELLSFEAAPRTAEIAVDWAVGVEIDLAGYRLQRSSDGREFVDLMFVPAMDYGSYSYMDKAVVGGQTYYYRLSSEDLDGSVEVSPIVVATMGAGGQQVAELATRLYPNPASDQLTIELAPRADARAVFVSILDQTGRTVASHTLATGGVYTLDVTNLVPGAYIMHLTEGDRTQAEAIMIRR